MRQVSEHSERFIENYSNLLKNELAESIIDMVSDEDEITDKISISPSETVVCITVHLDEELSELAESKGCTEPEVVDWVEVQIEWFEDDGLVYSKCVDIYELNISQLFAIYNYCCKA